ncbi:MAG TPA: aldehyde dehydrogenase family protein [Woeseiaceae bacterium]|nr:aldehyde dehydrogenase family protein [Woeseiaceae bacterium]
MSKKYDMTINGRSVPAESYREIRNPANLDEVVGLAPIGSREQVESAVSAAREAFASWRHSSEAEREAACRAIAQRVTDNAAELAVLLTKEQGKPLKGLGAEYEVGGCAAWASYTAGLSLPTKVIEESEKSRIEMRREPLGVVASITPWNWPLLIAIWHVVPAVRTGNTVVLKPSPFTTLGTLRLFELIADALPPGLVNVVAGDDELGALLTRHEHVHKVVFTGSIATGRKIMSSAAPTLKPLTLELGGNDPAILLPDADPSSLAEGLFWGSMINSGQTCGAIKRLYVHDSLFDRTCEALVAFNRNIPMGDGMDESNLLGPLQNERQFKRVVELTDDAKAQGATILTGGEPLGGDNWFYPVTFVTDIGDGTRLVDEEQFGPVLPIIRYHDVDEAIARANGLEYGLAASVWGADPEQTEAVAGRLEAGTVWVNKHAEIAPHVPFGGIKCSGIGVEFGEEGLAAYTSIKVINRAA